MDACGGALSLMDAGWSIKDAGGGAMSMVKEGDEIANSS